MRICSIKEHYCTLCNSCSFHYKEKIGGIIFRVTYIIRTTWILKKKRRLISNAHHLKMCSELIPPLHINTGFVTLSHLQSAGTAQEQNYQLYIM